ncbi:MAG: hypothetical protein ACM3PW_10885 [Chlamydiota bacterium]
MRALLIAATLLVSYAYFYQGTGWNQNSHFYLGKVLIEQHTVRIDRYQNLTGDKAFYEGHYYSDKAPGLSLAALPAIKAGWPIALHLGVRPRVAANVQLYLATLFTCSLGIALAAAILFVLLLNWNMTPGAAAFAALIFGLGTPMWIYATQFWGHALASACLVFAFAAADGLRRSIGLRHRILLVAAVGLAAGWAVVTEYPAAIPAVMIGVMALMYCWRGEPRARSFLYAAAALYITAGLCLATILIYQKAAFGSPFRLGYEYVVNYQDTLHHGALGVTYPKWHALMALLFGKRCGLLLFAPILLAAPFGFRLLWRAGLPRLSLGVSAGIAVYYLLFNASYLHWGAGSSLGPRYLSPGLPFACLLVAPVWQQASRTLKAALAVVAAYGVAVAFAGVTTHPVIPEAVTFPVKEVLQAFTRGDLYQLGGAWNLGMLAGLQGMTSLAPLLALGGFAGLAWWHLTPGKSAPAETDAQHVSSARVE